MIISGTLDKPLVIYTTSRTCPKARMKDTRTHTFLVFSSSKVIQSGRYYKNEMEPAYRKFLDFVCKNREQIELQLNEQHFDMSRLKGIRRGPSLKLNVAQKSSKIPVGNHV